jgi:hypothetical protein
MIETVAKALRKGWAVDMTDSERLALVDRLRRFGRQLAESAFDEATATAILQAAADGGATDAIARLGITASGGGATAFTTTAQTAIAAQALDLRNGLKQMDTRISRWMPDAYQEATRDAVTRNLGGVIDLRTAQREAASELLGRGVRGFTDRAGRQWEIGSYSEMSTRTAAHRAFMEGSLDATENIADIHLVTIVITAVSCKECAAQRGKVFSTDGTPAGTYSLESAIADEMIDVVVVGGLDIARAAGWDHPNCTCQLAPFLPGTKPVGANTRWTPEKSKARDDLRALERGMRGLRRQLAAAMTPAERKAIRARIADQSTKIGAHAKANGLVRKPYRESLTFATGSKSRTAGTLPAIPSVPTL